jgi:hypothetical protein
MEGVMLLDKVVLVLEVAHLLVELPALQSVLDTSELFILPFNLSDNGIVIGFKLGTPFMVAVVLLNLCSGGKVYRMDCHSQSKEWSSVRLQELLALVEHSVKLA